MQLLIETDEEYAPLFRAVAKAVKAKVSNSFRSSGSARKARNAEGKGPFIDPGTAKPGETPSDFFKGAWEKDLTRTAKSIREAAWKRKS